MEKIKLAIEKAKADRNQLAGAATRTSVQLTAPQIIQDRPHFSSSDLKQIVLDRDHLEDNRIITFDRSDPKGASFDMLRTQISQRMGENGWQTLAITSPRSGCGKTVTAINLAFSVARHTDRSAILVDLDLRKPSVAKCLGINVEKSLVDYLQGTAELHDILVCPDVERLTLLVNNRSIKNASEVITSRILLDMIAQLRKFDPSGILIFDLPPMLSTDDVLAFFPQVDCTLLLVASGYSTISEVESCERYMQSTNYLGVVLNKFEGTQEEYY